MTCRPLIIAARKSQKLGHAVLAGCQADLPHKGSRSSSIRPRAPGMGSRRWFNYALARHKVADGRNRASFACCGSGFGSRNSGLDVEFLPTDWRRGLIVAQIEAKCSRPTASTASRGDVVHNETSTSASTHPVEVRKALHRNQPPRRC